MTALPDHGKPSAAKRGRNPKWPYVPIVVHGEYPNDRTEQIRAKAFETRAEAVAYAARMIEARRAELARKLTLPHQRALREQYGLPAELNN